jgi:hypothetical protein
MMARSTALQSKVGYIDARPLTPNSSKSSCYARPDHTSGSFAPFWLCLNVRFAPNNDRMADIRKRSKRAKSRRATHPFDYPAAQSVIPSARLFADLPGIARNQRGDTRAACACRIDRARATIRQRGATFCWPRRYGLIERARRPSRSSRVAERSSPNRGRWAPDHVIAVASGPT